MRAIAILMLLFLSFAGTCFADDPLETLNTVEETLSAMEETLEAQAWDASGRQTAAKVDQIPEDEVYFASDQPLGPEGWVKAMPCNEEGLLALPAPEVASCATLADQAGAPPGYIWKSRPALPSDLNLGVMVLARDKEKDGAWYLARITGLSDLGSGYLAISAPFRAHLKGLRIVEE